MISFRISKRRKEKREVLVKKEERRLKLKSENSDKIVFLFKTKQGWGRWGERLRYKDREGEREEKNK